MFTTNFSLPPEFGTGNSFGRDSKVCSVLTPSRSAAISVNGLNAEPGWRWPLVARLNGRSSKSSPPTIAFTSPVLFSIATSDALGPMPARFCEIAASAAAWSSGSSVVLMSSPPPKTTPAP